ncbi:hypothetical protein [Pectinatus frisingensis]|uniref:hypothetical protein n=1 Tax=Pectinatus frisingensis TaxID=865 RepID=UPI001E5CE311|nr:hypothetical protein [Pectinatus frisingensis]
MKNSNINYFKIKQAVLPLFISDYLDICDPVLVFGRFMEEISTDVRKKSTSAKIAWIFLMTPSVKRRIKTGRFILIRN